MPALIPSAQNYTTLTDRESERGSQFHRKAQAGRQEESLEHHDASDERNHSSGHDELEQSDQSKKAYVVNEHQRLVALESPEDPSLNEDRENGNGKVDDINEGNIAA